jgi:hypothetical protein
MIIITSIQSYVARHMLIPDQGLSTRSDQVLLEPTSMRIIEIHIASAAQVADR